MFAHINRAFHISEAVFAGYTHALRGAQTPHCTGSKFDTDFTVNPAGRATSARTGLLGTITRCRARRHYFSCFSDSMLTSLSIPSRAFHISEDVFAGYNHTLRGAQTKFLEFISVGKGRDMGFDSINSFESKVLC